MIYDSINNFLINHVGEITLAVVTLIYIFFYQKLILLLEKIVRAVSNATFENKPGVVNALRIVDSFVIFLFTIFFLIPIAKILLEKYLEPKLNTPYLFFIVLGVIGVSYIYYILVYSKHLHNN